MITPAQLLHRTHQFCRERHNHVPNSACRKCFLEVFEDSIAEAYPKMKRGDVFELVQEEAGINAWVDTTIRMKHAHVFAIDESFPERFADWAEP